MSNFDHVGRTPAGLGRTRHCNLADPADARTPLMLRTPFIDTLSDLFIRSTQWRGRDELFVDAADRITGAEALDSALRISHGLPIMAPGRAS